MITGEVWEVRDEFSPAALFLAAKKLLLPDDIVVIGAYDASDGAYAWLVQSDEKSRCVGHPVRDSFDVNRQCYPRGQAFFLPANENTFDGLTRLLDLESGGPERALFFDHLACYRPSVPMVPLINFHDAFSGGVLILSGLYTELELNGFLRELGANAVLIPNPEFLVSDTA